MSKSLDALQRLFDHNYGNEFYIKAEEDAEIIEKELKRLEDIDSILNTGGGIWAENGIVAKKLKAFELIKKKRVNVAYLIWCIETFDYKEGLALENYNLSCVKDEWKLTQEEFKFLEGEKL